MILLLFKQAKQRKEMRHLNSRYFLHLSNHRHKHLAWISHMTRSSQELVKINWIEVETGIKHQAKADRHSPKMGSSHYNQNIWLQLLVGIQIDFPQQNRCKDYWIIPKEWSSQRWVFSVYVIVGLQPSTVFLWSISTSVKFANTDMCSRNGYKFNQSVWATTCLR